MTEFEKEVLRLAADKLPRDGRPAHADVIGGLVNVAAILLGHVDNASRKSCAAFIGRTFPHCVDLMADKVASGEINREMGW